MSSGSMPRSWISLTTPSTAISSSLASLYCAYSFSALARLTVDLRNSSAPSRHDQPGSHDQRGTKPQAPYHPQFSCVTTTLPSNTRFRARLACDKAVVSTHASPPHSAIESRNIHIGLELCEVVVEVICRALHAPVCRCQALDRGLFRRLREGHELSDEVLPLRGKLVLPNHGTRGQT